MSRYKYIYFSFSSQVKLIYIDGFRFFIIRTKLVYNPKSLNIKHQTKSELNLKP